MNEATPPESPTDLQKLDAQLCFALYSTSRLVTRSYQPLLEPYGITYPQYIVMLILWEEAPCPVSVVARKSLLNTNTLTPLLKRLEALGYLTRRRSESDERVVLLELTDAGRKLQAACAAIPHELVSHLPVPIEKAVALKGLLDELREGIIRQGAKPIDCNGG